MRIAQINVTAALSTGRIAVELCRLAGREGHQAILCHAREHAPADVPSIRIGNRLDTLMHIGLSRLTDRAGFFSLRATHDFIRELEAFDPEIIHLHNVHGSYLNLPMLFEYLKTKKIPVVWTLHDCWAYTGHCAYYTTAKNAPPLEGGKRRRAETHTLGCDRWMGGCGDCVLLHSYPKSYFVDQSDRNWKEKKELFTGVEHLVLTTPSEWLQSEVKQSFLQDYPVYVLPNGLDLTAFHPCEDEEYMDYVIRSYGLDRSGGRKIVLSVAAIWDERKGLEDLIELADKLGDEYCVAAVGVAPEQLSRLRHTRVMGIRRTGNLNDLCALYTACDVYVSVSHEETMGMTLVEALACGTQVICYNATAMPEIVTDEVGEVVELGDTAAMAEAVRRLCQEPRSSRACQARAGDYESSKRFAAYLRLYEKLYTHSPAYREALERAQANED